ncbi:protein ABHD11 [Trichonephila clavipes]|uniref:sn-1-specific diacylglycerol lipase ABHD11 n=1 Tax=Trichonephila clavipes TaxID=2585209 RepID=A0A8X6V254_TRICX|nr:protein ABHD11 [Trichonephila clavipes]
MDLDILIEDLEEFMNDFDMEQAILIGHSMGGKTALTFALKKPEAVEKLIVEDMDTKDYPEFAKQAHLGKINILRESLTAIPANADEMTARKAVLNFLQEKLNRSSAPAVWRTLLPVLGIFAPNILVIETLLETVSPSMFFTCGSINEYQACLETQTLGVLLQTDHLFGTSAHAPQRLMVMYTGMGTVGPGPHGLLRYEFEFYNQELLYSPNQKLIIDGLIETQEQDIKQPTRGLLATDHVILNHGQVTWTTPELAPPLLTTTPHQREDVSALDRFNVHRCPTRRVFSGTGLEPPVQSEDQIAVRNLTKGPSLIVKV